MGYYRNQRQVAQLITSDNKLVFRNDRAWRSIGELRRTIGFRGEEVPLVEARLDGRAARLLVWHWYWVDGKYTANPYWGKLLQAKSELLGRGDDGAVVIVYTEIDTEQQAAKTLHDFVTAMLPGITRALENARGAQR